MTRDDLDRLVTDAPDEELPSLVGQLASAHAMAFARLVTPKAPVLEPRGNISVKQAAKYLGVSPSWIYKQPSLPFLVPLGGRTLVDFAALEKFNARRMKGRG